MNGIEKAYSSEVWTARDERARWYCAHCQRGVNAREVTYSEQHEVCGRYIANDDPPPSAPVDGKVGCRCIDCGGNQPAHDPTCSYMHELHGDQPAAVDDTCAVAAIQFALNDPEGMTFLRLWNEGEFETLRREWPDAPSSIYIGDDPLTQPAAGR